MVVRNSIMRRMILVFHIAVALLGIIWSGITLFAPSTKKLRTSYALVGLTLVSGTYLVISMNSPLIKACLTGLVYLGITFGCLIIGQYRLAKQED